MRHFIVEITYTEPFERVEAVVPDHREYLQIGYKAGMLLISGPQTPRVGGILVARAESMHEVRAFCDGDPYSKAGVATHRIIEFVPMSFQPYVETWIKGK